MPAIIRKSTTSLQQRTLGSWWVIQLCAAEKGQAWWCHFISWPGSVGFEMALTWQCGNPRCWQLSVVTTPHHVAGVPWVEELEGGDESDLVGSLGYIIFHRKWFFFSWSSWNQHDLQGLIQVQLCPRNCSWRLQTTGISHVSPLKLHSQLSIGINTWLCFSHVIYLYPISSPRWRDPWDQVINHYHPKLPPTKWWNFIKNWHVITTVLLGCHVWWIDWLVNWRPFKVRQLPGWTNAFS